MGSAARTALCLALALPALAGAVEPVVVIDRDVAGTATRIQVDGRTVFDAALCPRATVLERSPGGTVKRVLRRGTVTLEQRFPRQLAAPRPASPAARPFQEGQASFYGGGDGHDGTKTANGERYDARLLTAAHKTLPFGTRVRVVRRDTGAEVVVRINDRGPFVHGRVIDLSVAAARALRMESAGLAPVRLYVVGRP